MTNSPSTIRVTHDQLARELEDAGKRLIELSIALRSGFDVPVSYIRAAHKLAQTTAEYRPRTKEQFEDGGF